MKTLLLTLTTIIMTATISAQGKFEVKDFGSFKLHTYITNDPMGDMSYIIEGKDGLVVLEPVAFVVDIKTVGEYIAKLNKPIEKVLANYHAAGASAFDDHSSFVMIDDMPQFVKGAAYSGMMSHFASSFGDDMDTSEFNATQTIKNNAKVKWVGVDFQFSPGATSDFPAASVLIDGKVYYTHFTPSVSHLSPLQITNREAVDATLAELRSAKESGATTFIGGHGIAIASVDAIDFQIAYLQKVKETIEQIQTGDEFILTMQMLYPNLTGAENVTALANNLYKKQ